MKATGIVRRIDDLGRVVIPKEIRRTLRLREGTPLEIFTDREGEIILKKYSPMAELGSFAKQYAESLAQVSGLGVLITDRDQFIAAAGGTKSLLQKPIGKAMETLIINRENHTATADEKAFIQLDGSDDYISELIIPIISEGDAIGAVLFLSKEAGSKMGEIERKLALTAANFLGRQMES